VSTVRLRVYVHGSVADEAIVDIDAPDAGAQFDAAGARQGALAGAASRFGIPWIAEAYRPDSPESTRYLRFGSDHQRIGAHQGREMPETPASGGTDRRDSCESAGDDAPTGGGPQ
jgi:hypothetical protein